MASLSTFLWGISYGALLFMTVPLLGEKVGFTPTKVGWVISAFGWGHVAGAFVFPGPYSLPQLRMPHEQGFGDVQILSWTFPEFPDNLK
jgi:hypothetical protein